MKDGINQIFKGIRIVEIAPVEIMGEKWLCVGFEEKEVNRGDNLHLALILNSQTKSEQNNLINVLKKGFNDATSAIMPSI